MDNFFFLRTFLMFMTFSLVDLVQRSGMRSDFNDHLGGD